MYKQSFNKLAKEFTNAERGKVRRLFVPERTFLAVNGTGQPGGPEFSDAIKELYGLAYAIKFLPKRGVAPLGYAPYRVNNLEGVYYSMEPAWKWTLMLPQPEFVTQQTVDQARTDLQNRRKPDSPRVQLLEWQEGYCIQTLHVGPYRLEQPAVDLIMDYVSRYGLKPDRHHEIYLNDPRRVGEDKAKTIIRYAISALQSMFNP